MSAQPDFVMVGGQSDGKFYIIASKTLTQAELNYEAEYLERLYFEQYRALDRQWYQLKAEMRDVTMVVGDSYAEAFRTLFDEWTPEPERPAIAGIRAVTQRGRNIAYHELGVETPALDAPKAIER